MTRPGTAVGEQLLTPDPDIDVSAIVLYEVIDKTVTVKYQCLTQGLNHLKILNAITNTNTITTSHMNLNTSKTKPKI